MARPACSAPSCWTTTRPVIRHGRQHRNADMKPRHFLARIAALVTAAAAIGILLGVTRASSWPHSHGPPVYVLAWPSR
jgi:hypothetical protein